VTKTLILAEKEDAAERMAEALGCSPREGYWESDELRVVAARGHLLDMWLHGLSGGQLPATEEYWRVRKQNRAKLDLIRRLAGSLVAEAEFMWSYPEEGAVY
jgi:DNA topoisomerase IA